MTQNYLEYLKEQMPEYIFKDYSNYDDYLKMICVLHNMRTNKCMFYLERNNKNNFLFEMYEEQYKAEMDILIMYQDNLIYALKNKITKKALYNIILRNLHKEECIVCLTHIEDGVKYCLECSQPICRNCINQSYIATGRTSCPSCNSFSFFKE